MYTEPENFLEVKDALLAAGFTPERSEVVMSPSTTVELTDVEVAGQVLKMLDRLEDLDDVQNVYSNAEFSEDVLAAIDV